MVHIKKKILKKIFNIKKRETEISDPKEPEKKNNKKQLFQTRNKFPVCNINSANHKIH